MILEALQEIGLNRRESLCYTALLELGSSKIGAITKKTEIPSGKQAIKKPKPQSKDYQRKTNNAGGILGGISTGEDIVLRVAVKPPSSIALPQETVTINKEKTTIQITGRHDPCICPRVVPVVEAMLAVTLIDCMLIQESVRKTA